MSTMKLTLLTDFYELTMMQGYFKNGMNGRVVFDAFYRKNPDDGGYAVCAGLDQVIDYIQNCRFHQLGFHDRGHDLDKRLMRKNDRSFRNRVDIAGEAEIMQIIEEVFVKHMKAAQVADIFI